jgi:micrococcal nuclease
VTDPSGLQRLIERAYQLRIAAGIGERAARWAPSSTPPVLSPTSARASARNSLKRRPTSSRRGRGSHEVPPTPADAGPAAAGGHRLAVRARASRHKVSDALFGAADKAGVIKTGRLVRVVDGDTVGVRIGGREQVVRLIGIDTPESVRPGVAVECGAKAASAALKRLARPGARVRVVSDPTQATVDRYGWRLGYVALVDGPSLQLAQLRAGWADVYVYGHTPSVRVEGFRKAAEQAEDATRGVWRLCGGDFHRPAR